MREINKKLSLVVVFVFLFSQCLSGMAFADTQTGNITKAELASSLAKTFNLPVGTYQKFSDVSSKAWYKDAVGKATLAGIMSTTSKSFKPNSTMSRKTGAEVIYKAFRQAVPTISKPAEKLTRLEALKWIDKLTGTRISQSSSSRKTYGNVVINKKDIVLKNATIKGNLIIAQGVGSGNVTLDNVKVEKTMIVLGGGVNSIKMNNSAVNLVYVDKKDGKVRLVATGATQVGNVNMKSGGKLEEYNMAVGSAGFSSMTVTGTTPNAPVILNAELTSVTVGAPNSFVEVLENVTIFTAEAACTVSGDGNINYADIEVAGVVLGNTPANIRAREGITVEVEGVVLDPTDIYESAAPPPMPTVEQATDEQYFTFDAGTKTITGYNTAGGLKVVIPSTIDGVAVTSIGVNAFMNKGLTKVTIGNNITSIGSDAFAHNSLTSVIIPDSITYLDWEVFAYNSLTGVTIPNSVTGIGQNAFYMNNPLASLTIGNRVTSIGDHAFEFADLTSITIPSSVINIGTCAFRCNFELARITIGPGVILGDNLLDGTIYVHSNNFRDSYYPNKEAGTYTGTQSGAWVKLTEAQYFNFNVATKTITGYNTAGGLAVLIPAEIGGVPVISIGDNAFNGKSLTRVIIGSNVTRIGNGAFGENSLTSIKIPDNVTTIGNAAFKANAITSATIGNKATSIGDSAFSSNHLASVTIGSNVTSIGANAFEYNSLGSITIGSNVTSIGANAFKYNSLASITIGSNVTSIGANAFENNSLTSITIPNNVINIGEAAFSNNSLTSVIISSKVTSIGDYLLTTLNNNFREQYLVGGAGKYIGTQTGAWIKPTDEQYFTFNAGTKAITGYNTAGGLNIILPLTIGGVPVTAIGDNAFNNKALISVILGSTITSIGNGAFSNNNLTSIIIPDNVTKIGALVFENNSLASVTIPDNVTTIGEGAFRTNSLTSVIMPDKISSIGDYAFTGNQIVKVTIPNSLTSIGKGVFSNNSLTDIIVTDKVTSIGEYAFSRNNLNSITIGSSVTSIGAHAFSDNFLASVAIPDNVNTIGTRAFANNLLTNIIIGADVTIADNLLSWDNNFRDAYHPDKTAGVYTGTQEGAWIKEIDGSIDF